MTRAVPPVYPTPTGRRLAVRVTRDAERQIRGGHPWLFDRSITSVSDGGVPGDLAVVFDSKRRFLAIGLYDPSSPIRVRILHHGDPETIDESWWHGQLRRALDRRVELVDSTDTTAWRWVHGENDQLPGLVVDRYERTLVVKVYSEAWLPHLGVLAELLVGFDDVVAVDTVLLRLARNVQESATVHARDGSTLVGSRPTAPVTFLENGLVFEADLVLGQKTGHFLDQRDNRARVRDLAAGRETLDVFCCTGGFSVHAAAGGASTIRSVDVSPGAIRSTERNMALNAGRHGGSGSRHTVAVADAADEMARLARTSARFGLVVIDPPSLAAKASQTAAALGAYRRLGELASSLVEPGGVLVAASCSSRVTAVEHASVIHEAARARGRRLVEIERTGHAVDHPVGFPQGAYLKALFTRVD